MFTKHTHQLDSLGSGCWHWQQLIGNLLCTRQFFIYTSRISVYDDLPLDDRDRVGRP